MNTKLKQIINEVGIGRITPSAYDTAWAARLNGYFPEISRPALDWLRESQLPDGSWGVNEFFHYHDRLICTLSATIALQQFNQPQDMDRIEKAMQFLEKHGKNIDLNPVGATVAFEMIAPTLAQEIQANGNSISMVNGRGPEARQRKLSNVPSGIISHHSTMAHSAEMAGFDEAHIIDWSKLLEENGSAGYSPAATCYYIMSSQSEMTEKAKKHLEHIFQDQHLPTVSTIDVFEVVWSLWNIQHAYPNLNPNLVQRQLDFIDSSWVPGFGTSFARGYTPKDGDDTSMAFEVLLRGGRNPDLDALLNYEELDVFRCFYNESDRSVSTNIHVLGALRQAEFTNDHPVVQKAMQYLHREQNPEGFWLDKWHTSPYYPTSHYVVSVAGYSNDMALERTIDWLISTQNANGSWGYIVPTAEETAYSLMALAQCKRVGYPIDRAILQRGKAWLLDHQDEVYTPLWVGKCLYSPVRVVSSTIFSALVMVDDC